MRLLIILAASAMFLASPAVAQTLSLKGSSGQTATLTAADLAAMPRATYVLDTGGRKYAFQGVMLSTLAAKVGAPAGKDLRGPALAQVVLVKASDGYVVAYSLGEIDPGMRSNKVILADSVDGQPLGKGDGPFKVFVEGDLRPARGVRMVTSLEVVSLADPEAPKH